MARQVTTRREMTDGTAVDELITRQRKRKYVTPPDDVAGRVDLDMSAALCPVVSKSREGKAVHYLEALRCRSEGSHHMHV